MTMSSSRYSIGLDFGTESARAVLVDVCTGRVAASTVFEYPDGVIDQNLPETDQTLPPDWALQNPADWLRAVEVTIPAVLHEGGVAPEEVVGIGMDFTSCTILPTTANGTPLCQIEGWRDQPHAWPKLWKHHAAQPQADKVNRLAIERGERFIKRYGGKISSEWLIPKALQILEETPETYDTAARIIEGGDWVVWQLTGNERRNTCAAGYKACWEKGTGYPSPEFLAALHPQLGNLVADKLSQAIYPPGTLAGGLRSDWAVKLRLKPGTSVGVAMIDAHAGTLGSGVAGPGVMAMVMGTSTCHMLMSRQQVLVEGISGVVEDGIVPGLFGYEAGQVGAGDMFAWFVEHSVPYEYHCEAERRGLSLHELLTEKAQTLRPGQSGLLALDWWNGCRTPLVDADLSGVVLGYTLATKPEEVYRALIESTAYGTRLIVDLFIEQGVAVERLVSGGGLTRNPMLMQIYADVTGREIAVAGTDQATALGAAMLGATAAGRAKGGYDTLGEAAEHMAPQPAAVYHPIPRNVAVYNELMAEYARLVDLFGRRSDSPLKVLRRLRGEVLSANT
jgi:L-ribulokinase